MKGGSICFCIPAGRKDKHEGTDESSGGKSSRRKSHKKGKKSDHRGDDEEVHGESAHVGGAGNPSSLDAGVAVAAVSVAQMSSGDGSSHGGGGDGGS